MATSSGLVDKQELIDAQLDVTHLGRVANSIDAGGNPITTSTNRTGGVNRTLDGLQQEYQAAIQEVGLTPLGDGVYATGKTYTAYDQYLIYVPDGTKWGVKPTVDITSGYTTTVADPNNDPNLRLFNEIDERNAVAIAGNVPVEQVAIAYVGAELTNVRYLRYAVEQVTYYSPVSLTGTLSSVGTDVNGVRTVTVGGGPYKVIFQSAKNNFYNVLDFGAGNGIDDTNAINLAIQTAKTSTPSTVYLPKLPSGLTYKVTKITRESGVSLLGDGSRNTVIEALPYASATPFGIVEMAKGRVIASHMKGIGIRGSDIELLNPATNAGQWGLLFDSRFDDLNVDGGMWFCNFEDVEVRGTDYGWWSRGGYTNAHYLLPNQFNTFKNCTSLTQDGGEAYRFTGQHGQISVQGGDWSGYATKKNDTNIVFDWDPNPAEKAKDGVNGESVSDVAGVGNAVLSPTNVIFESGVGIQRSSKSIFARNCNNVNFDGAWFESLGGLVHAKTNAIVTIDNSRIANAANGENFTTPAAGTGWVIKQESGSSVKIGDSNFVIGTLDNWIDPLNLTLVNGVSLSKSNIDTTGLINITNPYLKTLEIDGSVNIKGFDDVWVRSILGNESVKLTTINGFHTPGNTITIRANSRPLTISNAGNIHIPGSRPEVTVLAEGYIILRRVFGYSSAEWIVVSVSDNYASAKPTGDDYFAQGTVIYNSFPTSFSVRRWLCTTAGQLSAGGLLVAEGENGESIIPGGNTSVIVTHGNGITPKPQRIHITQNGATTNPVGNVYVSLLSTNTFQVNIENDPGASGFSFGWIII